MTRKKLTYEVLNQKFLNADKRIMQEFLNEQLQLTYANIEALANSKRRATSLAWDALVTITDEALVDAYGRGYRCNNLQLKTWLREFGDGFDTIKPTVDYITMEREE